MASKPDTAVAPYKRPFGFVDDEAVNFVDNSLIQLDPKFASIAASYDNRLAATHTPGQTTPTSVSDVGLVARQKCFEEAIKSYLSSRNASKLQLQVSSHSNWPEVLEEVRAAQDRYQGNGEKGVVRSLREKLRSFSRNTEKIQQWLQCLPSESWQGSLVCGGIKIVLQTARRLGKMREDICDAIELVPELIASTQALEVLYPGGKALRSHATNLYISILDVLEISLAWYDRSPFKKVTGSLLKGSDYDAQLASAVGKLKSLEVRLDKQASLHGQFAQARIEQNGVEALAHMKAILVEQKKSNLWQAEREQLQRELADLRAREQMRLEFISEERRVFLLRILQYGRITSLSDLEAAGAADATAFDEAQDRIAYLLQRPEFAGWLGGISSSALIVNGSEPDHAVSSATSLFTAMVVRALEKSKQAGAVVVHWFCAQHVDDGIPRMLRGLLGQLLDQMSTSIEIPRPDRVGRTDDALELIRLLGYCIKEQLRFSPVYCVIDAVSFYEDQRRCWELCRAFNRLATLTFTEGPKHAFKMLVTSPTRAIDICESSAAAYCIILDAEDEVNGSLINLDEMDVLEHTRACLERQSTRRGNRPTYV